MIDSIQISPIKKNIELVGCDTTTTTTINKEINTYKLYSLIDPSNDFIRYVGLTKGRLNKRLSQHIYDRHRSPTHKTKWIQSLLNKNIRPYIDLIEEGLTLKEALEKEIIYIKLFKSFGADLVNSTSGGDNYVNMTKETIAKMSLLAKNKNRCGIKNSLSKPILQIDKLNGNILSAFENTTIATKILGFTSSSIIYDYIQGRRSYGGGYDWKTIPIKDYNLYKEYHNIPYYKYIKGQILTGVIALYPNKEEQYFDSLTEAQRILKVDRHSILRQCKLNKIHEKTGIYFKLTKKQ